MGRTEQINICQREIKAFEAWLTSRELSDNTISSYVTSVKMFFTKYSEATKVNAAKWKKDLVDSGIKPKTVNIRLNGYNAYCAMKGMDAEKVKTIKIHNATAIDNVISETDYRRLLDGLKRDGNTKWYYNVKLLAVTGARISEYVRLKKSDFDRGYAEMWTKGKMRRIYIPESFRNEAGKYYDTIAPGEYLVQNRYGQMISKGGVAQMLQRFAAIYNIDKKVMHPHSFRHLFALEFLKRNNDISLLCDVMGHSSVATTAIYTRMTMAQQQSAVNNAVNW